MSDLDTYRFADYPFYARRRLGGLETVEDARKWALIAYFERYAGDFLRLFTIWFNRDDRIYDLLFGHLVSNLVVSHRLPHEKRCSLFLDLLGDTDWRIRYGSVELLGAFGTENAIGALTTVAIGDPDFSMRSAAISAIVKIDRGKAIPVLERIIPALRGYWRRRYTWLLAACKRT